MAENETYNLNFFFRDYVTDDILSYCIGDVYFYHYKETLFGMRDVTNKRTVFVDIASIKQFANHFAPTLDQLTEQHIKEAYEECDHTGESDPERVPINELAGICKEALGRVVAAEFDKVVLGNVKPI